MNKPIANDVIQAATTLETRIGAASRSELDVIIGILRHLQLGLNALESCGFDHRDGMRALRSANAAFDIRRAAIRGEQHAVIAAREIRDGLAPGGLGMLPAPKGSEIVAAARRLDSWISYNVRDQGEAMRFAVENGESGRVDAHETSIDDGMLKVGSLTLPTDRIIGVGEDRSSMRFMLDDGSLLTVEIDPDPATVHQTA